MGDSHPDAQSAIELKVRYAEEKGKAQRQKVDRII